jgi:hypothetical protein
VIVTLVRKAANAPDGVDSTQPTDYTGEAGEAVPPVSDQMPEPAPTT